MGKLWTREVGRRWDSKGCVEAGGGGRGLRRGLKGGDGVDGGRGRVSAGLVLVV